MDGTLGSQTALMPDGTGVEITSARGARGHRPPRGRLGWPVAVHAIGDRANQNALDAFEETRDEWQPLGLRHRIEHAQCLAPEDVGRFAELGLAASVQFSHAPSDRTSPTASGPTARRRLRLAVAARLRHAARKRLRRADRGARPVAGIRAGVLRRRDWRVDRAGVTVEEALVATTVAPAWQTGDERRRGKLLPGYLADLVVLDRDPLTIPPEELPEVAGRGDDGRRPVDAQPSALE